MEETNPNPEAFSGNTWSLSSAWKLYAYLHVLHTWPGDDEDFCDLTLLLKSERMRVINFIWYYMTIEQRSQVQNIFNMQINFCEANT